MMGPWRFFCAPRSSYSVLRSPYQTLSSLQTVTRGPFPLVYSVITAPFPALVLAVAQLDGDLSELR